MKNIDEDECDRDDYMSEVGEIALYLATSLTSLHSEDLNNSLEKINIYYESQNTTEKLIDDKSDDTIQKTDQPSTSENLIENKKKNASCQTIRYFKGYIYLLASAVFYALTQILMKMAYTLNGIEHATIRYLIQLTLMAFIIRRKKKQFFGPKNRRNLLISRGIFGVIGLVSFFCSIKFINPSDATAISHSSLIITSIFARIFLKEMLSFYHVIATILTLLGVVLISKPSFIFSKLSSVECLNCSTNILNNSLNHSSNATINLAVNSNLNGLSTIIGISLAMIGAITTGIVYIVLKKLSNKDIHYSIMIFYAAFLGLPICLIGSISTFFLGFSHQNLLAEANFLAYHILLSFTAGALGLFSNMLIILSFKYTNVSVITTLTTIDVLFAFLLQYMILDIPFNMVALIGAFAILSGIFIIFLYAVGEKYYRKHKEKSVNNSKSKASDGLLKLVFHKF